MQKLHPRKVPSGVVIRYMDLDATSAPKLLSTFQPCTRFLGLISVNTSVQGRERAVAARCASDGMIALDASTHSG